MSCRHKDPAIWPLLLLAPLCLSLSAPAFATVAAGDRLDSRVRAMSEEGSAFALHHPEAEYGRLPSWPVNSGRVSTPAIPHAAAAVPAPGARAGGAAPDRRRVIARVEYVAATLAALLIAIATAVYLLKRQLRTRTAALAAAVAGLRAHEAQIASIIEGQADAVIIVTRDGIMRFANAKAEEYLGKPRAALLGRAFGLPMVSGESAEPELHRPAGGPLPVEMRAQEFTFDGRPALLASLRDISDRKEAERARQESAERLAQSQKMEAVGQLTGGIAHDFNNILAVILGNLQLLQRGLPDDQRLHRQVDRALGGVHRGADLTKRLLAVSRRQNLEPQIIDVGQLLDELMKLIARTIGHAVEIQMHQEEGLWHVRVDPGQLENAILNLCVNARDAMPDGGTLTIGTANRRVPGITEPTDDLPAGDYVCLSVSDTGTGMPKEVLAQIFEPFFTTKERDRGTGLGLSMVYGFVKQSNGQVLVTSEPSLGTTVRILLPRVQGEARATRERDLAAAAPTGHEAVLLVDDDAAVRETVAALLEALGYTVAQASSGPDALRRLSASGCAVDVLVTDVVMPGGMSGVDLLREARRLRPGLPALIMSGFTDKALMNDDVLDQRTAFAEKPASNLTIAQKLRGLLDGATSG